MTKEQRKALRAEHSKQVGAVRAQFRSNVAAARVKRNEQLAGLTKALDLALMEATNA